MPQLPNPEEIARPRLQPATGVARYRPGQVGAALEQAGRATQQTASQVQQFADQTAELHARDALVSLKRQQNQLTVGEDGYARLLNGAATEPGVVQRYKEKHENAVQGLATKLSPTARAKFERMAQEQGTQYQAGLYTHIMRQDMSHRGEVYSAQVGVISETMGINYNNPDALLRERTELDRTVADYVVKQGIKDESVIERMLQDARGRGHQAVITGYLDAGRASDAEAYFNAAKQEMLPEVAKAVNNMLKPEVANETGRQISEDLFNMHLEGRSESDIFAEKLKMTEGKSLDVIRVSDKLYSDRVRALEEDRTKTSGGILLSVYNGERGSGFSDPRLREIDRTDPLLGVRVRGQIESIQKRHAAPGGAAAKAPADMVMYARLTEAIRDPDRYGEFGIRTVDDLVQYADKMPKTEFKQLLNLQASVNKPESASTAKARIPVALINAGMPKSAIKNMEHRNAYKGFVETKLQEWKEAHPGRTPTLEEQQAIVASATEEHIEIGTIWNTTVPAFRVREERATYPRAFGRLMQGASEDVILEAYSFVQQVRARLTPADAPRTDAEIIELWQRRRGNQ